MNDDPRGALVQRLMQLQQTGDPRHVLDPAALHAAELLARQTGEDPATAELLGWFHLYRYLALPAGADSEAREAAIFYFVRAYGDVPAQVRQALGIGEGGRESTGAAQAASGQAVSTHQRALEDLRHAMASRDLGAVKRATAVLQSTVGEIPPDDPHHWMALFNVGAALLELFKLTQRLEDVDAAVANLRAAAEECGRSTAGELPEVLTRLGMAYRERFGAANDPADLTSLVEAIRSAAAMTPPDSPDYPRRAGRYSRALGERFDRLGARDDLDAAIGAARQAVAASERVVPLDLDECVLQYGSLGTLLQDRFERFGTLADLDEAISAFESALTLTLRQQSASLSDRDFVMLSVAVGARLDTAGYSDNVSGPIETLVRGVQRLPEDDAGREQPLSYLATSLWDRYKRTNDLHDLEAAISLARTALDVLPASHPARAGAVATWTRDLQVRAERTEDPAHREAAINASRTALAAVPGDQDAASTVMFNLALLLYRRFTDNGRVGDLDEAIALLTRVLTAVPGTLHRPSVLDSLGNMLSARYELTGVEADLDAAIGHLQAAADSTDTDDPALPRILSNLAGPLEQRYRGHGQDADLELAGKCLQKALASPAADPKFKPTLLHNLGTNRLMRFERYGQISDLSAAVDLLGQALDLTAGHRRAPYLATLAAAHVARFDAIGELTDLDLAIDQLEESIRLTPDSDPDLPMRLSNLGAAYRTRSVRTGAGADLESAISRLRSAVLAAPPDHVGLGSMFSNLGNALKGRYRRTADPRDLDEAVAALENAVRATPPDSPELAKHRTNLVSALIDRAGLEGDPRPYADHAVDEATRALSALPVGNPTRPGAEAALATALESRFRHGGARSDLDLAIAHGSAAADALPADHPQRAVYLHNLGVAWKDAATHAPQNRPDAHGAGPQEDRFEPYRRAVAAFRAAAEVVTAGPASRCQSAMSWGRPRPTWGHGAKR